MFCGGGGDDVEIKKIGVKNGKLKQLLERRKPSKKKKMGAPKGL